MNDERLIVIVGDLKFKSLYQDITASYFPCGSHSHARLPKVRSSAQHVTDLYSRYNFILSIAYQHPSQHFLQTAMVQTQAVLP